MMLHSLEPHRSLSPLPADTGSCASIILLLFLENFFSSSRCLGNQCGSGASCPSSRARSFRKIHWPFWATRDVIYEQTLLHQSEAERSQENASTVQTPRTDSDVQHPLWPHIPLPYEHSLLATLHQAMFMQCDLWDTDDIIKTSQKTGRLCILTSGRSRFALGSPLMSLRNAGFCFPNFSLKRTEQDLCWVWLCPVQHVIIS